ncbi:MAG: PGN_0703 family putative restriction endonuclease [Candidatus Hodarchaeales archaeon]
MQVSETRSRTLHSKNKQMIATARAAIDLSTFPWHQAEKIHSSQALAIDVFGTIKQSPNRNLILNSIAEKIGLEKNGNWFLELEWKDPDNLVQEHRQTQVDAVAWNDSYVLF